MKTKRFVVLVLSGVLLLLSAGAIFGSVPDEGSATAGDNSIEQIPMAGRYAISAAIGLDQQKFHGVPAEKGVELHNTPHNLAAIFDADGLRVYRNGLQFGLTLSQYGYDGALQMVEHAAPVSDKNRVEYKHGFLTEWYVNGPLGLQQGFTLEEPPAKIGMTSGRLSLVFAMQGNLTADVTKNGRTLQLSDATGMTVLQYSGLVVFDAENREFPAQLYLEGSDLIISVDDTGARYPLTIDPIFENAVLTHDDEEGEADAYLGMAVAVSGDTVVVGAPDAGSSNNGRVYVFVKTGSSWADMMQTQELRKSSTEDFGAAVAISGDLLVVGDPLYDVWLAPSTLTDGGMAFVYYKDGGVWKGGRQLHASDRAAGDEFGTSVAISGDTVVVGAPKHDTRGFGDHGQAYVYANPPGGWNSINYLEESAILDDGRTELNNYFGSSVAVDGDTVVVGIPHYTISSSDAGGMAMVFEKPGGGWTGTVGSMMFLNPGDKVAGDNLGTAVAISGDNVLVSAPNHGSGGAAYIFIKPVAGWTLINPPDAKLTTDDTSAAENFGSSVAINGDTALIGASAHNMNGNAFQGAAYIFSKPGAGWSDMTTHTAKLTNSDGAQGDWLGRSVALDGSTAVAGAPLHDTLGNTNQGAAYVFTEPATGWADMDETAQLRGIVNDDNFGQSVAISGDTVVVGANSHMVNGYYDQGAAYVFVRTGSGWSDMLPAARLTASDGAEDDRFGFPVAISGDVIIAGAYGQDISGNSNQGAAYVFVKPSAGWTDMTETAKLTASDGAASDYFGDGVAIDGDTAVVGADGNNSWQGAAYVYVMPASGWADMTETAKLTASDGVVGSLGWSVDVQGETVVAGAPWPSAAPGAAYVFVRPSSGWSDMTETARLITSDGAVGDEVGVSVSVDNITVAVSAQGHNSNKGAVYVYTRLSSGWSDMTETAKLTASDGAADDYLGWNVDISGDTVVVAAEGHDTDGNLTQGAAYVFVRPSSGWANMTETDKIVASDGVEGDAFGESVAIRGQTIVAGSQNKEFADRVNGAVYVYTYPKANKFPWAMFLPAINGAGQ